MGFDNLNTDGGLAVLNAFLADKSYIEGFAASQADVAVFEATGKVPCSKSFPHAARWYKHIAAHQAAFASYASHHHHHGRRGGVDRCTNSTAH